MRWLLVLLLMTGLALAQVPTEQQILGSTIGNLFAENARLAVELQKAQIQIKALSERECK